MMFHRVCVNLAWDFVKHTIFSVLHDGASRGGNALLGNNRFYRMLFVSHSKLKTML